MTTAISDLSLDLPRVASGKVREMFDAGDHLLMVATDRISVFDVVLPTPIPDKGKVLTGLSRFWFEQTASFVPNHLLSTDLDDVDPMDWPRAADERRPLRELLAVDRTVAQKLSLAQLDACFDDASVLRHVPAVIGRLDALVPTTVKAGR